MMNYIKIARPDHWIKQLFIVPGMVFAVVLIHLPITPAMVPLFLLTFLSTSCIASANYVINEWLDAKFDKFHPVKKKRPVVANDMRFSIVMAEYIILAAVGLALSFCVSGYLLAMEAFLLFMGILYNVNPVRTKDIPYLDVLSESLNNGIRLMIGWFAFNNEYLPPISIVLGYWLGGAFLMATKRYAEYRMINDKELAGLYRKSFKYYSEQSLLISAFFYAMSSVFFCGIFMIKYKIELIFAIPLLCGLFCYYLSISYKEDSSVQKPEKSYREKGLMAYLGVFVFVTALLCFVQIPVLDQFLENMLLSVF